MRCKVRTQALRFSQRHPPFFREPDPSLRGCESEFLRGATEDDVSFLREIQKGREHARDIQGLSKEDRDLLRGERGRWGRNAHVPEGVLALRLATADEPEETHASQDDQEGRRRGGDGELPRDPRDRESHVRHLGKVDDNAIRCEGEEVHV